MPTVNQGGVDTLMGVVNNNAAEISETIHSSVANMCSEIGQVWGCKQAQNFANDLREKMINIVQNLRTNMDSFYSNIDANVQNYNAVSEESTQTPAVSYNDASVDTSGIQGTLPNGSLGLAENTSRAAITQSYLRGIDAMQQSIASARNSVASSGAFDADETERAAEMYNKVGRILVESNQELSASLNSYLDETIATYEQVKSQNINRSESA